MFALFALTCALGALAQVPELPPIPRDLTTPVQQRIAYDGATGMTIGWNTFKQIARPTVHFGFRKNALFFSASSKSSVTYPTSRTWANTVHLEGLLPGTKYYYSIDSTNSTIASFTTALFKGDMTPFSAALVVDMGVFGPDGLSERNISYTGQAVTNALSPGEHTTIQRLVAMQDEIKFILHPGDFAYADAWLKEETLGYINGTMAQGPLVYEGLNEQFWDQLAVVSANTPYMVAPGNHEANCDNGNTKYTESICPVGQTNFTGFLNRFGGVMPGASDSQYPLNRRSTFADAIKRARTPKGKAVPPFWYSFDYGMAHFVMFDTETDLGVGIIGPDEAGGVQGDVDGPFGSYMEQQIDFLTKDLASVDRLRTPWIIAAGHRPWYVANPGACWDCQKAFEPIFNTYGVDLVVSGHTHNMERHMPIANNVTDPAGLKDPKAPMYIVNGAAGHFEGLDALTPLASYTAFANDTLYGFSKLVFHDRHNLEVQMIASSTGAVIDTATLYKSHKQRYVSGI